MTDAVQIALIASIAPTLAASAAVIIGILNRKKADETGKKADAIIDKAEEIHVLTNSNLTKVTQALTKANRKISALERLVMAMVEEKKARRS